MKTLPALSSSLIVSSLCICFMTQGANALERQGPLWDTERGPLEYNLEPSGSDDIDDGSDLDALRAAFAAWGCTEGSAVRFIEGEPGIKSNSLEDGLFSVYFDEAGDLGLGEATYSASYFQPFLPGEDTIRDQADIVFNGFDHTFKTDGSPFTEEDMRADIQALAMAEIGNVLGFSACDENQENCSGTDVSVMAPFIGPNHRNILAEDEAALREFYATDDGSSCDGPFRQGEACGGCNEDCAGDLICATGDGEQAICTAQCSGQNLQCPVGYGCLFAVDGTDDAPGYCVRGETQGGLPPGASCGNDRDCLTGSLCLPLVGLGRSICQLNCDSDADCGENYTCDRICLYSGDSSGEFCEEAPPGETGECSCSSSKSTPVSALWFALSLVGLALPLRRRNT